MNRWSNPAEQPANGGIRRAPLRAAFLVIYALARLLVLRALSATEATMRPLLLLKVASALTSGRCRPVLYINRPRPATALVSSRGPRRLRPRKKTPGGRGRRGVINSTTGGRNNEGSIESAYSCRTGFSYYQIPTRESSTRPLWKACASSPTKAEAPQTTAPLAHGFGSTSESFQELLEVALSSIECASVIAHDHPGFGLTKRPSQRPSSSCTLAATSARISRKRRRCLYRPLHGRRLARRTRRCARPNLEDGRRWREDMRPACRRTINRSPRLPEAISYSARRRRRHALVVTRWPFRAP